MAITTEWSINNMVHVDTDGGVILVYWSIIGKSDGDPVYTASDGGKLKLEYDASKAFQLSSSDILMFPVNSPRQTHI